MRSCSRAHACRSPRSRSRSWCCGRCFGTRKSRRQRQSWTSMRLPLRSSSIWTDGSMPTTVRSRIVLLVDDLQWADPATLDVLLYLMSRPADGRLCIVVTVRDGHVGASGEVDRWLANVRRMPGCEIVLLGPLDRAGTTDQLTPASRRASASVPRRRRVAACPRIAVSHRARCRRRRSAGAAIADPDAEGPRGHRA